LNGAPSIDAYFTELLLLHVYADASVYRYATRAHVYARPRKAPFLEEIERSQMCCGERPSGFFRVIGRSFSLLPNPNS
jgi:hypothetical protein